MTYKNESILKLPHNFSELPPLCGGLWVLKMVQLEQKSGSLSVPFLSHNAQMNANWSNFNSAGDLWAQNWTKNPFQPACSV